MDYKQKYEQALERARTFNQRWQGVEATDSELALQELKEIFPELKESEDERIKKAIVNHLLELSKSRVNLMTKTTYENWIAWLEKQGEQKPALSEEDYNEIGVIACHLDNMGNEAMANSLLCIRDKYNNVKPKHAWSKEDEKMLGKVITTIRYALSIPIDSENDSCFAGSSTISWLKSLKQRMKGE